MVRTKIHLDPLPCTPVPPPAFSLPLLSLSWSPLPSILHAVCVVKVPPLFFFFFFLDGLFTEATVNYYRHQPAWKCYQMFTAVFSSSCAFYLSMTVTFHFMIWVYQFIIKKPQNSWVSVGRCGPRSFDTVRGYVLVSVGADTVSGYLQSY